LDTLMSAIGIVSVPLLSGVALAEKINTLTVALVGPSTQAVVMAVPPAGAVCTLAAVFAANGMVMVAPAAGMLTVSASGRLALMVTVLGLEFNWAAAGVVARAIAMIVNAVVAKTLIENLIVVSFCVSKCSTEINSVRAYCTKDK
jgi:hypothetical protein